MKTTHLALLACLLAGCTSVTVTPLPANVRTVHIRTNPEVTVGDFVPVMTDGFHRHGIAVQTLPAGAAAGDYYVVDYTARRSWDVTTYLSQAEITVTHRGDRVGYAEYHLRGKGGMAVTKWAGVKSKIDPVMDELLQNHPIAPVTP